MFENDAAAHKDRHTTAGSIEIDARDVLAGHWDAIRMGAER